ncbi:MAG TPA: dethiobiotin synthase [Methylotenera sp.]
MPQSYFVIGTDTNVGKTYVASALLRHFVSSGKRAVGMKPVASGCELSAQGIWQGQLVNDDVVALYEAGNVPASLELINPYHFEPAIAPHIAAEKAGVEIDLDLIVRFYHVLAEMADVVVVEGAGGFFVPVNNQQTLADLTVKLHLPIILVVGMRLGCINHALLTVEAIRARGLTLAGWVANRIDPDMSMFEENLASLQQRIEAPCLGVVPWQAKAEFNL